MTNSRDSKFYNELKQLNSDFIAYLTETNEKSPYFDLTPTVNDYVKHFSDLEKQYPEKSLFGQVFQESTKPFIFGTPAPISSITSTTTTTPSFSFTLAKKDDDGGSNNINSTNDKEDAKGDAEEDVTPPEPNVDKYEEQGAKYSVKCKLYEKTKDFDLIGIGFFYVKALETPNKVQVIFRQEPDLRRVLLNEVITSNIPVKLLPKAIQMLIPRPNNETKFYIVKVRDEKDAETLYNLVNMQS